MAKKLQLRRGTTAQHGSFTGAVAEVLVDVDKNCIVVSDGSSAGGFPTAKESVVNNLINGDTIPTTKIVAMGANDMDLSAGEYFTKTISGNTTFTFSNVPSGYTGWVLEITNGGSATISWPASAKFGGGVAPALTASGVDVLVFTSNDQATTVRGGIFSTDNK